MSGLAIGNDVAIYPQLSNDWYRRFTEQLHVYIALKKTFSTKQSLIDRLEYLEGLDDVKR